MKIFGSGILPMPAANTKPKSFVLGSPTLKYAASTAAVTTASTASTLPRPLGKSRMRDATTATAPILQPPLHKSQQDFPERLPGSPIAIFSEAGWNTRRESLPTRKAAWEQTPDPLILSELLEVREPSTWLKDLEREREFEGVRDAFEEEHTGAERSAGKDIEGDESGSVYSAGSEDGGGSSKESESAEAGGARESDAEADGEVGSSSDEGVDIEGGKGAGAGARGDGANDGGAENEPVPWTLEEDNQLISLLRKGGDVNRIRVPGWSGIQVAVRIEQLKSVGAHRPHSEVSIICGTNWTSVEKEICERGYHAVPRQTIQEIWDIVRTRTPTAITRQLKHWSRLSAVPEMHRDAFLAALPVSLPRASDKDCVFAAFHTNLSIYEIEALVPSSVDSIEVWLYEFRNNPTTKPGRRPRKPKTSRGKPFGKGSKRQRELGSHDDHSTKKSKKSKKSKTVR